MIDLYEHGSRKYSWWQDWRGECVAIVGAGPTAKTAGVEKLRDRIHVVVVNESYRLAPWAEILYCADTEWWNFRKKEINGFGGLKLSVDPTSRVDRIGPDPDVPGLQYLRVAKERNIYVNEFRFTKAGEVGSGGNSGFQMINLSAQMGATGIALIGFDMSAAGGIHWHGLHPNALRNPDHGRMQEWRKDLDAGAPKLKKEGIDVVNCSPMSALTAFPKMTIDQMLERWSL